MKTKKLLSVLLAALMIFSLTFVAFGVTEVTDISQLEGFVPVKHADDADLADGDLYMTREDFSRAFYELVLAPLFYGLSGWTDDDGKLRAYDDLDASDKAYIDVYAGAAYSYSNPVTGSSMLMYNPTTRELFIVNTESTTPETLAGGIYSPNETDASDRDDYRGWSGIIQTYSTAPQQETPTQPDDNGNAPKLNFFQRIIQWFKDLFAKLFKR